MEDSKDPHENEADDGNDAEVSSYAEQINEREENVENEKIKETDNVSIEGGQGMMDRSASPDPEFLPLNSTDNHDWYLSQYIDGRPGNEVLIRGSSAKAFSDSLNDPEYNLSHDKKSNLMAGFNTNNQNKDSNSTGKSDIDTARTSNSLGIDSVGGMNFEFHHHDVQIFASSTLPEMTEETLKAIEKKWNSDMLSRSMSSRSSTYSRAGRQLETLFPNEEEKKRRKLEMAEASRVKRGFKKDEVITSVPAEPRYASLGGWEARESFGPKVKIQYTKLIEAIILREAALHRAYSIAETLDNTYWMYAVLRLHAKSTHSSLNSAPLLSKRQHIMKKQTELAVAIAHIRGISITVLKAVLKWRSFAQQEKRRAEILSVYWHGENYLFKMSYDVHRLYRFQTLRFWLGFEPNPFFIPPCNQLGDTNIQEYESLFAQNDDKNGGRLHNPRAKWEGRYEYYRNWLASHESYLREERRQFKLAEYRRLRTYSNATEETNVTGPTGEGDGSITVEATVKIRKSDNLDDKNINETLVTDDAMGVSSNLVAETVELSAEQTVSHEENIESNNSKLSRENDIPVTDDNGDVHTSDNRAIETSNSSTLTRDVPRSSREREEEGGLNQVNDGINQAIQLTELQSEDETNRQMDLWINETVSNEAVEMQSMVQDTYQNQNTEGGMENLEVKESNMGEVQDVDRKTKDLFDTFGNALTLQEGQGSGGGEGEGEGGGGEGHRQNYQDFEDGSLDFLADDNSFYGSVGLESSLFIESDRAERDELQSLAVESQASNEMSVPPQQGEQMPAWKVLREACKMSWSTVIVPTATPGKGIKLYEQGPQAAEAFWRDLMHNPLVVEAAVGIEEVFPDILIVPPLSEELAQRCHLFTKMIDDEIQRYKKLDDLATKSQVLKENTEKMANKFELSKIAFGSRYYESCEEFELLKLRQQTDAGLVDGSLDNLLLSTADPNTVKDLKKKAMELDVSLQQQQQTQGNNATDVFAMTAYSAEEQQLQEASKFTVTNKDKVPSFLRMSVSLKGLHNPLHKKLLRVDFARMYRQCEERVEDKRMKTQRSSDGSIQLRSHVLEIERQGRPVDITSKRWRNRCALIIQCRIRIFLSKCRTSHRRTAAVRLKAARLIQRIIRGFLGRRRFEDRKRKFQVEILILRKHLLRRKRGSDVITSFIREAGQVMREWKEMHKKQRAHVHKLRKQKTMLRHHESGIVLHYFDPNDLEDHAVASKNTAKKQSKRILSTSTATDDEEGEKDTAGNTGNVVGEGAVNRPRFPQMMADDFSTGGNDDDSVGSGLSTGSLAKSYFKGLKTKNADSFSAVVTQLVSDSVMKRQAPSSEDGQEDENRILEDGGGSVSASVVSGQGSRMSNNRGEDEEGDGDGDGDSTYGKRGSKGGSSQHSLDESQSAHQHHHHHHFHLPPIHPSNQAEEDDKMIQELMEHAHHHHHQGGHHHPVLPIELQDQEDEQSQASSSHASIIQHIQEDLDKPDPSELPPTDEKMAKTLHSRSNLALKHNMRFSRLLLRHPGQLKRGGGHGEGQGGGGISQDGQGETEEVEEEEKPTFRQFAVLKDRTFFAHKRTPKPLVSSPYDVYVPPIEHGKKKIVATSTPASTSASNSASVSASASASALALSDKRQSAASKLQSASMPNLHILKQKHLQLQQQQQPQPQSQSQQQQQQQQQPQSSAIATGKGNKNAKDNGLQSLLRQSLTALPK